MHSSRIPFRNWVVQLPRSRSETFSSMPANPIALRSSTKQGTLHYNIPAGSICQPPQPKPGKMTRPGSPRGATFPTQNTPAVPRSSPPGLARATLQPTTPGIDLRPGNHACGDVSPSVASVPPLPNDYKYATIVTTRNVAHEDRTHKPETGCRCEEGGVRGLRASWIKPPRP